MVKVAEATGDLEAIIARTALKYDLLPYESKPFAQSQPARLGALARLFGLEAAPMENARVLELGCASGGNIIPHAALYPNATFVGVDLARTQVAAGRARIERMGLDNVEILCKSFTEIGEELGAFDYTSVTAFTAGCRRRCRMRSCAWFAPGFRRWASPASVTTSIPAGG